ncbi:hypothetical protein F5I97DRAFT_31991 [Phlebopus sp. FC_14]|nr:hypothetical protein F5I97DRAFT_31991 [Phlebopus sp. FC_14]
MAGKHSKSERPSEGQQHEQQFTILPHPAKTNNPADLLEPSRPGADVIGNPGIMAHNARGPHVPSQQILSNLEAPKGREELKKRAEELNKD